MKNTDAIYGPVFDCACANGDLKRAKRLVPLLSGEELPTWLQSALVHACDGSQLEQCKEIFWTACIECHVEIAKLILANSSSLKESLSAEEIEDCTGHALRQACSKGNLPMVQFLISEFSIPVTHEELRAAVIEEQWPIMVWLLDQMAD